MDFATKDLLINFLFLLLALCLIQILHMVMYTYRLKDLKGWGMALFPIISIILCMLFPVYTENQFIWDVRWIPFILGGLYGGWKLSLFQLFLVLFIRYFFGGDGFYTTLIAFTTIGIIICFLSKYYLKMPLRKKIGVSLLLTVMGIGGTLLTSHFLFSNSISLSFGITFAAIHILGTVIVTILWEVIKTNFHLLQKLIKAEKMQIVNHLAASISHEVRNPLTVSRGFIQLLSEDLSADKRREYVHTALQELDRATEIINDYLTFAKPTLEKTEKIDIHDEILHAVNVITPLANMNSVFISLSPPQQEQENYFALGERKKFQQCIINILKNGIESMKDKGGKLQIYLTNQDDMTQIEIHDEGTGMTQEQINRLGEPYFTTKEKGTGLGMMVSYSIIKGMNGNIKVLSSPKKGTTFILKLPVYQKP